MRAVGLDFERRALSEIKIPEPRDLANNQVHLRILEVGVCGTDRELARFRFGRPPEGETVLALGHEALAEVVASRSTAFSPGDLVVPMIRRSCQPACLCCHKQRRDLCLTGNYQERGIFGVHGYFSPFAVDDAEDLVRLPAALAGVGVLVEPLSVVEKAVEAGLRAHMDVPRTALVLGAGPVGVLAALTLQLRGLSVSLHSLEPRDHARARLVAKAGARFVERDQVQPADLVIEATGSPSSAPDAMHWTATNGVAVLLGANDVPFTFPGFRAVVENLTVLGIVNAGPGHFAAAVNDLRRFDQRVLTDMISRRREGEWRESIGSVPVESKVVHVLGS